MKTTKDRKKKGMGFVSWLLLAVCSGLLIYSGYNLYQIYMNYKAVETETEQIIETYVETNGDDEIDPYARVIDFDKLLKRNKDVVGWLYIPNTKIDEPLLLGETNDEYIKKTIDHSYSFAGSLFVESMNDGSFEETNTTIYGHNMKNGSKFHDLRYFINKGKKYLESHNKAYIYLPDGSIKEYELFASGTVNDRNDIYNFYVDNQKYYGLVMKNADIKRDVDIDKENPGNMIMLSTCHSSAEENRYVVWGMEMKK